MLFALPQFCSMLRSFFTLFLASLHFLPPNAAEWSPWNHWSLCFEHLSGISAQTRTRACLGGNANACPGSDTQAKACLPDVMPIKQGKLYFPSTPFPSIVQAQAEWTSWSEWTECQSLPGGTSRPFKTRWRICDRRKCEMGNAVASGNTKNECIPCHGSPIEQKNCAEVAPVGKKYREQCQWNEWSAWSACSTTCGSGTHLRVRNCPCQKCSPAEVPTHEEEICYNLLPCPNQSPFVLSPLSAMAFNVSNTPALFDPCSVCPANYPWPCYTCLNLHADG